MRYKKMMMKKINRITIAFLMAITLSCSTDKSMDSHMPEMVNESITSKGYDNYETESLTANGSPGESSEIPNSDMTDLQSDFNRKMIWNANIEFQVKDVNLSSTKLTEICKLHGGFISNMNMTSTNRRISNRITIRVTNNKFHALISDLKGESIYIDRVDINSNDVTEEFVDIESRLKTKKDVRERYINILRNKTGKIKDVIEAEEAIRRITEEIEAKEGRLRFLKDQVSFSTISVSIYQKVEFSRAPDVYEKSFGDDIADSFGNGWMIITTLILILISIWPFLLIGGVIIFIWRRRVKRKKKKQLIVN